MSAAPIHPSIASQFFGKKISDLSRPPPPISVESAIANIDAFEIVELTLDPPGVWDNPHIGIVSVLEGYPYQDLAESFLRWINRAIVEYMEPHNWTVDHLTEFYPTDTPGVLGQNTKAGHLIEIRLRDPYNAAIFRPFSDIMSSIAHELSHNTHMQHHDTQQEAAPYPRSIDPAGHIAISTGGQKILLTTSDWQKHFSIFSRSTSHLVGLIHIPRRFEPSVFIRLVQLAKGLDAADDKPLWEISNLADYWSAEVGGLVFADIYMYPGRDAGHALPLYLNMYNMGEELGWHRSSRNWLLRRTDRLLRWYARSDTTSGRWMFPSLTDPKQVSLHLRRAVQMIYDSTTVVDQALRDVVVNVMREVLTVHHSDLDALAMTESWDMTYDTDEINALLDSIPELKADL